MFEEFLKLHNRMMNTHDENERDNICKEIKSIIESLSSDDKIKAEEIMVKDNSETD